MFAMQIGRMNVGPFGSALAFFEVLLGRTDDEGEFTPLFAVREMVLKQGAKGYYYQSPAKQRLDKQKKPVMKKGTDGNEYPVYDSYFDLALTEDGQGNWKPSSEAFDARSQLLELAVKAYEDAVASKGPKTAGAKGTGGSKPAPKPGSGGTKPAPKSGGSKPAPQESFADFPEALDGEDDDLPF